MNWGNRKLPATPAQTKSTATGKLNRLGAHKTLHSGLKKKKRLILSLFNLRYNLLPRIIEAKYLDAMDAEH